MHRPTGLSQWQQTVSMHLPHLSKPQVAVLALWSLGIVLAQHCGLSTVSFLLGCLLDQRPTCLRERLRDWLCAALDKSGVRRGHKRRSLLVSSCFAPLLRWVLSLLPAECRRLALVMDASTLSDRFIVLSLSVVVRGSAIRVAWHIRPSARKGAWRPEWEALFGHLHGAVPEDWTVIVLADRGLWAKWLFQSITAQGWHPFLRINRQGHYQPAKNAAFRPLSQVVKRGGAGWAGRVTCFATKARQLECTLLARWEVGYRDPWLILTDLAPEAADVAWYGLRAWVETGYKQTKRGGWHWEQSKLRDPERAERLWLALAVATLWVVSVGSAAEAAEQPCELSKLPARHVARRTARGLRPPRTLSCYRHGRLLVLASFISGGALPPMALVPEPWPESLDRVVAGRASEQPHSKAA